MPKPKSRELIEHAAFLRRQNLNERKYQPGFLKHLNRVYAGYARAVEAVGPAYVLKNLREFNEKEGLTELYLKLYKNEILKEVTEQDKITASYTGAISKKDIIDDLASLIPFSTAERVSEIRKIIDSYILDRIGKRVLDVSLTTIKKISEIIEKGINQGLGGREIAEALEDGKKINETRALVIARTETVSAMNQGKYISALTSIFVMQKRWMPTGDEKTRHSHMLFWDSDWIDLNDLFLVEKKDGSEDSARYPGDETLSAENAINCRCASIYRPKKGPNGRLIRRK